METRSRTADVEKQLKALMAMTAEMKDELRADMKAGQEELKADIKSEYEDTKFGQDELVANMNRRSCLMKLPTRLKFLGYQQLASDQPVKCS